MKPAICPEYANLSPSEMLLKHLRNEHAASQQSGCSELIIVEGKSAADAVDQVRDRQFQSIYRLQGKIPNPDNYSRERLQQHAQLGPLLQLLGEQTVAGESLDSLAPQAPESISQIDFVILLQDPDIDGVHNISLLLRWFQRYLLLWIHTRRLRVCQLPLAIVSGDDRRTQYVYDKHRLQDALTDPTMRADYYKGVASINKEQRARLLAYPLNERSRPVVSSVSN